jgi:hypothetical protein
LLAYALTLVNPFIRGTSRSVVNFLSVCDFVFFFSTLSKCLLLTTTTSTTCLLADALTLAQ